MSLVHRLSLAIAIIAGAASIFFYAKIVERDRLLDALIADATRGIPRENRDAIVLALSREIFARTDTGIRAEDLSLFDRLQATSFFNVGTSVALRYGTYGVIGHGQYGPCGTMSRVLLNACWRLDIPARKLQLLPNAKGQGGGHTMVEYSSGGRWVVISPGDSSFVWRTRDGHIASLGDIRSDSTVFAQIYAHDPHWPYRFDNPSNIRWEKLPPSLRSTARLVLGPELYARAKTPRLYDLPRTLLLIVSLGLGGVSLVIAYLSRPRQRVTHT